MSGNMKAEAQAPIAPNRSNGKIFKIGLSSPVPLNALRRDGLLQTERFPAELAEGYFRIDERGLEELLEFAMRLAAELRFEQPNSQEDLNWQAFLAHDPSVVLAQVMRFDLEPWHNMAVLLQEDIALAVATFLQQPNPLTNSSAMVEQLREAVGKLQEGTLVAASPVAELRRWVQRLKDCPTFLAPLSNLQRGPVAQHFKALDDILIQLEGSFGNLQAMRRLLERFAAAFEGASQGLYGSFVALRADSRLEFERSIQQYDAHSPHLGLFISFLQLYGQIQGRLNSLLPAHLNHYYREVLRFPAPSPSLESVHLMAQPAAHLNTVLIPKGTAFEGPDKVVYVTEDDHTLGHTQIQSLLGLQRQSGLRILRQGSGDFLKLGWPAHASLAKVEAGSVGWAFSSHVLRMEAGRRRINVGLRLDLTGLTGRELNKLRGKVQGDLLGMRVSISTVQGWKSVSVVDARLLPLPGTPMPDCELPESLRVPETLFIDLVMDEQYPAVISCLPGLHGAGWDSTDPVLRFEQAIDSSLSARYGMLSAAPVLEWHISVVVSNRQPLMENDSGPIDGSKTFAPFGPQPSTHNRWSINVEEAASKVNLKELTINWAWGELGANEIAGYFSGYTDNLFGPDGQQWDRMRAEEYRMQMVLYDGDRQMPMYSNENAGLDTREREMYAHERTIKRSIRFGGTSKDWHEAPEPVPDFRHRSGKAALRHARDGYSLQFNLRLDRVGFGHQHWALAYANANKKLMELQAQQGESLDLSTVRYPNPPVTPTVSDVVMAYVATDSGGQGVVTTGGRRYHLTAFGQVPSGASLLPRYDSVSELYIGLGPMETPGMLSMLVQLEPGSGQVDSDLPTLTWSYLSGDEWVTFAPSEIDADSTMGMQRSGILRFVLPANMSTDHRAMPTGMGWLRLSALGNSNALERIVGLHAQAFMVRAKTASPTGKSLAPKQLQKPMGYVAGLKELQQPYSGFGAQSSEGTASLWTWASERLGHRGRSINLHDYERIVLSRFFQVHQVKCINHCSPGLTLSLSLGLDNELSVGHVTVVCVPSAARYTFANPLQPKFGRDVLAEVQAELQEEVPPFVEVHAVNAHFLELTLAARVVFRSGVDPGRGMEMMNEAISRYMCPWAYDERRKLKFGGIVHRSQLLNVIEQLSCVDVVAGFEMRAPGYSKPLETYEARFSREVIVSALEHNWEPTTLDRLEYVGPETYGGIGIWRIDHDFEVNGK